MVKASDNKRKGKHRYIGVRDQTGLVDLRACARDRDTLAYLFNARVHDTTCTQAVLANCGNVKRRRRVPTPPNWKARIAATRLLCRLSDVTRTLQEHVEVECEFLGVPKVKPSSVVYGAMAPGDVTVLTASGRPVVGILCAPLTDTEWYCHAGENAFSTDGLFLADVTCEVQNVSAEDVRRGGRLLELAQRHHEALSATIATAAFRAAKGRVDRHLRPVSVDALVDYFEPNPFEWPSIDGWESQVRVWTLWMWRTADGWQQEVCVQHLHSALRRGVFVPAALRALRDESRMQGPYPENALESVALKEMRTLTGGPRLSGA